MSTIKALVVSHGHGTWTYDIGMQFGDHTITHIDHSWHDDLPGDGLQHRDYHLYIGDQSKLNDMQLVGTVSGAYVISVVYDVEGRS